MSDVRDVSVKLNKALWIVGTISLAMFIPREAWSLINMKYTFSISDIAGSSALFGYFIGDLASRFESSEVVKQFWTE